MFVFLQASLPKDHEDEEASSFHSGQGGALQAIMCVDKTLDELSNFADLVEESKQMDQDWNIVLVAGLAGQNGIAPLSSDADQPLKTMVSTVETGGDLSKYMAFDKNGEPVQFN